MPSPAWLTIGPLIPSFSMSACGTHVSGQLFTQSDGVSRKGRMTEGSHRELEGELKRTFVSAINSGNLDSGTQTSVTQHLAPLTYSIALHSAILRECQISSASLSVRAKVKLEPWFEEVILPASQRSLAEAQIVEGKKRRTSSLNVELHLFRRAAELQE